MEKKFSDIINEGTKTGKSYEEINAELKAAGANFHLDPDGHVAGWSEAEMAEGFRPGEPAEVLPQLHACMGRDLDKADMTVRVRTAQGQYDVTRDVEGYAVKAVLVKNG